MMKKILVLLILMIVNPVFAGSVDYGNMCPVNPYKSSVTPSKIVGMNWLSEKIAQGIIKKELQKETKGKFKVTIKSRGMGDLLSGKFNYLSMTGKDLNVEGSYISKFTSTTVCDYNSVKLTKDNIFFRENMVLNYEMEIDNEALEKSLKNNETINSLKNQNITLTHPLLKNVNVAKISDINLKIRNNKIYFMLKLTTPFVTKPISITVSSGINVKNGRIQLTGLKSINNKVVDNERLYYMLEKINPLAFTSEIMNNKNAKVSIDSAKILNDVIIIKGLVLIPKNCEG